ncbi:MAG: translation elongation factor Ts [Clostridiaceae bacterium]|nr:translation elongation factor Ts [Clostridiaceae bacterium]
MSGTDVVRLVRELRERTGAGMMDCKKALLEHDNDIEKAVAWLREKGMAGTAKKSGRVTSEGIIATYVHPGNNLGVLVEVNIETDFAARNEDFIEFARDCAMQIAAMNAKWVKREDVPAEAIEAEREIVRRQALNEGKPERIVDRIVEGRMSKFYSENCLMEQTFVKDESKTMEELRKELSARLGENIVVRRFVRYQLGEGLEKRQDDFAAEVANMAGV